MNQEVCNESVKCQLCQEKIDIFYYTLAYNHKNTVIHMYVKTTLRGHAVLLISCQKKVSVASHRVAFWFLCGELSLNRLFYINGDLNTTKPLKGTGSSCVLIAF